MEGLNQAHYNEFNTIPDVARVEDISIGVWDGFSNNLGSLDMGFDLPDALSPEAVETTVTTATLENFASDSDTEVIVAPELIAEINEIGRRVLAGYNTLETGDPLTDEEWEFAEPAAADEPTGREIEPPLYAASEDQPLIDESSEDSINTSILSGTHFLDLFVELDSSTTSDSAVVTPEEMAISESEVYNATELTPYLGSVGMTENTDLILIDEQASAEQATSRQLTAEEEPLDAEALEITARNQTPEMPIYASGL